MLVGSYSLYHLRSMYNDPLQRHLLRKYMALIIIGTIIWFIALILLVYYWDFLETWAKVVGIAGLFFNVGGSLLTVLVVFFGMKHTVEIPSKPIETIIQVDGSIPSLSSPNVSTLESPLRKSSSPVSTTDQSSSNISTPEPIFSKQSSPNTININS